MDDENTILAAQFNQLADSILRLADPGADTVLPRYRRLSEAGRLTREALRRGLLPELAGLPELVAWVEDPPERPEPLNGVWYAPCDYNLWRELAGFDGVVERAFPGVLAGCGKLDVTSRADRVDLMAAEHERWAVVLRWLAERVGKPVSSNRPRWDVDSHTLYIGDRIARRVKRPKDATNIILVLDCFQLDGWPGRIDSPLENDTQVLHGTIRRLNEKLEGMKFGADGTGTGIVWHRTD